MPRRNRRDVDAPGFDAEQARRGFERVVHDPDGSWTVRNVPVEAAVKMYRCPGCDHEIGPGVAHVVVWPADARGDLADRRHWHTSCWGARHRRRPHR
jgi:hypothetical protein